MHSRCFSFFICWPKKETKYQVFVASWKFSLCANLLCAVKVSSLCACSTPNKHISCIFLPHETFVKHFSVFKPTLFTSACTCWRASTVNMYTVLYGQRGRVSHYRRHCICYNTAHYTHNRKKPERLLGGNSTRYLLLYLQTSASCYYFGNLYKDTDLR